MAFKKFYPKYKKKAVAKKRVYKRKSVAPKTSMKMMIQKALDRRIENKTNVITNFAAFYQNGVSSISTATLVDLTPTILQGTSEANRIGNSVKLKNAYLKGFLRMNSTGTNGVNIFVPNQFHLRLFIGRCKDGILLPTNAQLNTLLRTGASTFPFNSLDGLSLLRPTNKEVFTIFYDKIFKIGAGGHSTGVSQFSTLTGINNNDYKLNYLIKIPCTKMMKKTLMFQDNASPNTPTNSSLFIFGGLVDSLASDTANALSAVVLDFDMEYSYEDA